jgi:hypothetical protein
MTRVETVLPTTTRQLALNALLNNVDGSENTVVGTGQDKTSSLASITLTSATSLVPASPTKANTIRINDLSGAMP